MVVRYARLKKSSFEGSCKKHCWSDFRQLLILTFVLKAVWAMEHLARYMLPLGRVALSDTTAAVSASANAADGLQLLQFRISGRDMLITLLFGNW